MCKRHWCMLPRYYRGRIWAHYVPGQEVPKDPTMEYIRVAQEARLVVFRIEYRRDVKNRLEAIRYLRDLGKEVPS